MLASALPKVKGIGLISSFYLPFGLSLKETVEDRLLQLRMEFIEREQKLLDDGFGVGILIITKAQHDVLPGFVDFIKEKGWKEVAASANPVHSKQTFCHLFLKEFNPIETSKVKTKGYKVLKIKKYEAYKVRSWLLSRWKNLKDGKLRN